MDDRLFGDQWNCDDIGIGDAFSQLPESRIWHCVYAQRFAEWSNGLITSVAQEPDAVGVNQAKLLLQDKWHDWRSLVPKAHRNQFSSRGHTCIFQVYEKAYIQLRRIELSLTPPLLFLPSGEPEPQIEGIFIGELE